MKPYIKFKMCNRCQDKTCIHIVPDVHNYDIVRWFSISGMQELPKVGIKEDLWASK